MLKVLFLSKIYSACHLDVNGIKPGLQLQLQYFIVSSQYIYETLTISNISIMQTLIRKRERRKERKEKRERKKDIK